MVPRCVEDIPRLRDCSNISMAEGREKAIDYARGRLGDGSGEIQVYDDEGARVIETIQINGRTSKAGA